MFDQHITPTLTERFTFLPNDDAEWVVHDLQELRFDPNNPSRFGFMVQLARVPPRNMVGSEFRNAVLESLRVFVPFSSFAYFGIGNIFQNGRMIERAAGQMRSYRSVFKPRFVTDGVFGRFGPNQPVGIREVSSFPINDENPHRFDDGVPFLRGRVGSKPAFLFMWEIVRFYLAGFSRLAESLILTEAFPEIEHTPLYDLSSTGLDGDKFVITPALDYADRASATQLAIMLSQPDILDLISSFAHYLWHRKKLGVAVIPRLDMLASAECLHFSSREIGLLDADGGRSSALLFGQILSDGRDLPFSELVIRDPRERSVFGLDDNENADTERRRRSPLQANEKGSPNLDEAPLGGGDPEIGEREGESPVFSIDQHFPVLRDVKVKVERKALVRRKKRGVAEVGSKQNRFDKGHKRFSNSGGAPLWGLWRERQKFSQSSRLLHAGQKLFLPIDVTPYEIIRPQDAALDARAQVTLDAAQKLWMQSLLRRRNLPRYARPEAMRLSISLDGGRYQSREAIFGRVKVGDVSGIWIELIRKGESAISIGLVIRTDGDAISNEGVVRILEHYSRRVGLRGEKERSARDSYAGVWPVRRDFCDVIGDRVTHVPPNNLPHYLANTIDRTFRNMASRLSD